MRYHLFQKFFGKMVEIKETSFLSTREDTNFLPLLYILVVYAVPGFRVSRIVPTILSSCFKSNFLQKVIHFCEDIFLTDFK